MGDPEERPGGTASSAGQSGGEHATGEPAETAPVGILSPQYRRMTIGIVSLIFLVAFEAMAVSTAMPIAVRDLNGLPLYAWAFSGFMAASMLATVMAGEATDRVGPLAPLVTGVVIFAVGLGVGGSAPTMLVFIGGRVLQGLGAGAAIVALLVVLARVYPSELRPKAFGAMSAAWVLPAIIGPSIAGVVAEHLSWRLVFAGLLPLVALPVALVVPRVRAYADSREQERDVTPRQNRTLLALSAALGVGMMQYAGQELQWWSVPIAAVGLGLLAWSLPKLFPAGTLRFRRGLPSVVRMRGTLAGAFNGTVAYVPLMLITVHEISATAAGIALTVGSLGWSTGSWLQARSRVRMHRSQLVRVGSGCTCLGIVLLLLVLVPAMPWWVGPLAWIVSGLGMGLSMASIAVLLFEYSPREEQGANSAAMQLSDSVGNVVLVGLGGVVFAGLYQNVPDSWAFAPIFIIMATVAAVGFATAGRLRRSAQAVDQRDAVNSSSG